jgi:hypothetical protein
VLRGARADGTAARHALADQARDAVYALGWKLKLEEPHGAAVLYLFERPVTRQLRLSGLSLPSTRRLRACWRS